MLPYSVVVVIICSELPVFDYYSGWQAVAKTTKNVCLLTACLLSLSLAVGMAAITGE